MHVSYIEIVIIIIVCIASYKFMIDYTPLQLNSYGLQCTWQQQQLEKNLSQTA